MRNALLSLRDELKLDSTRGNFSLPENIHLTLIFLGECTIAQVESTKTVMDALEFTSFPLSIERIGCFRRNDGDLWWAGVQESKPLLELHSDLAKGLTIAGFTIENRKYSPHVTLGRKVATSTKPRRIIPFGEIVTSIELMKSERVANKLTYTAIHSKGALIS